MKEATEGFIEGMGLGKENLDVLLFVHDIFC